MRGAVDGKRYVQGCHEPEKFENHWSKRQVERIRKCYQETGDVHDRPRSGRPRKTTVRGDSLLVRLSKGRPMSTTSQLQEWTPAMPVSSRTVRRPLAHNGLHGRIAAKKPVLNKKPCCVCQGPQPDGRLDSKKLRVSGPTVLLEDSQIWRWKDYGLRLQPIWRCHGDL